MKSRDELSILQIIPATSWFAVYERDHHQLLEPLVCWALVKYEGGLITVEGMEVGEEGNNISFVSYSEGFVRYHHAPLLGTGELS